VVFLVWLLVAAPLPWPVTPVFGATFTVNTTADTPDANPGDGVCADSSGNCSLRAAVMSVMGGNRDDIRREAAGARLWISSLGPSSYSFEISDLQPAEVKVATGVLQYSGSEVYFALQEQSGWQILLNARKLDRENSLIQLVTRRSTVDLIFNDRKLSILLERISHLDANIRIEELVRLASQIVRATSSFELYRDFISQEASGSRALALLAYLLAGRETGDQSQAINLLTSISRFLTPSIHLAMMAGARAVRATAEIKAVKASYAVQTDAACVAACAGVGGVGAYLCQNTTVGSPEWWVCLIGTWAVTTYCIYACTT
jgi:CSLREA domain-containing protein